jgi:hypothetical protein
MDQFKEQLVLLEHSSKYKIAKVFMIIFVVSGLFLILANVIVMGIVLLGVAGFIFYFKKYLYAEYEYSLTNGQIDIDVIYEAKSRKKVLNFNMKDAELLAPIHSDFYKDFTNKPKNIVSTMPDGNSDKIYAAIIVSGGVRMVLKFVPNKDFVDACFLYNPKAVKKNL